MYESIYKHPFRNILLRTKRVRNLICYLLARNLEKGEVSRDFNLHDHPILPVNIPDSKSDNQMGKLVPIDIVRNYDKDSRRYDLN